MKKVSIIIPCHNSSQWIRQCWESLKRQTMDMSEIECIFVDDASNDDDATWKELQLIEAEAPESIMIIQLDVNMRQGGARNVGMSYMSGEYMLFLDSDDLYRPETCEELYDLAQKNNVDIIQFDHDVIWRDMGDESIPPRSEPGKQVICDLTDDNVRRLFLNGVAGDYGCTNKFYKTSLLREVQSCFAEHVVYEEPLFVYPLFIYLNRIMIIDTKYYVWRKHENSTMTSELGKRLMEHPHVQLLLMRDIKSRGELYYKYKEEVDLYFFYSFMFETMLFSVYNRGELTVEQCEKLKELLFLECPEIMKNKYLPNYPLMIQFIELIANDEISATKWETVIKEAVQVDKKMTGKE